MKGTLATSEDRLWAYGLTWAVHIPLAAAAKGVLNLPLPPGLRF